MAVLVLQGKVCVSVWDIWTGLHVELKQCKIEISLKKKKT